MQGASRAQNAPAYRYKPLCTLSRSLSRWRCLPAKRKRRNVNRSPRRQPSISERVTANGNVWELTNPANFLRLVRLSPRQRLPEHLLRLLDAPTASAEVPPEAVIGGELRRAPTERAQCRPQVTHLPTQITFSSVPPSKERNAYSNDLATPTRSGVSWFLC